MHMLETAFLLVAIIVGSNFFPSSTPEQSITILLPILLAEYLLCRDLDINAPQRPCAKVWLPVNGINWKQ